MLSRKLFVSNLAAAMLVELTTALRTHVNFEKQTRPNQGKVVSQDFPIVLWALAGRTRDLMAV